MVPNYGYPQPQVQNYIQQPQVAQLPQPQRTYLNGKYISGDMEIQASEVPMDGNRSYFPSVDENYILVKYWDPNGRIVTKKYILEETSKPVDQPDILDALSRRFDRIESLLRNKKDNKQEVKQDV